uniref:Uncharacterized protein n=1 Tax=Anguilla anguilla TaxID=7936 RepID=A0A0E9QZL1_ANGAN
MFYFCFIFFSIHIPSIIEDFLIKNLKKVGNVGKHGSHSSTLLRCLTL